MKMPTAKCIADKFKIARNSPKALEMSIGCKFDASLYNSDEKECPRFQLHLQGGDIKFKLLDLGAVVAIVLGAILAVDAALTLIFNIKYRKRF
jgi:hypothetical protein